VIKEENERFVRVTEFIHHGTVRRPSP